jgi:hypothetical protein
MDSKTAREMQRYSDHMAVCRATAAPKGDVFAAGRCPTCHSPDPALHPAVQYEGEVQICEDSWHSPLPVSAG